MNRQLSDRAGAQGSSPGLRHAAAASLLAAAAVLGGVSAHADTLGGAGTNTIYAGVAALQNHASLGDLHGLNTPPGLNLDIGNATTLGLGFVHNVTDRWSVELALGAPPTVHTDAKGANWALLGIAPGTRIADVDVLSPTVFLNWHPLSTRSRWDPFVGLGVNYTRFANTKALTPLTNALGPTELSLSDSWGPAAHVGLTYHINQRWSVVGTVAIADVKSTLTVTSYAPSGTGPSIVTSQSSTDINFHPVIYTLAVGYSF